MWLRLVYLIGLGLYCGGAIAASRQPTPVPVPISVLHSDESEVKVVQLQLKALGYYRDKIDGQYSQTTQKAVADFQRGRRLNRQDGIADSTTRISLERALKNALTGTTKCPPANNPISPVNPHPQVAQRNLIKSKYSLLIAGVLGVSGIIGAILFLKHRLSLGEQLQDSTIPSEKLLVSSHHTSTPFLLEPASTPAPELPITKTSLLAQLNVVEGLIQELASTDPIKRRLAIWNLGQQGDSRAVQPLIDLMPSVDSQQRSLILSALAEICARTLKPMKRALAISMQDSSSQVRQNAIRDLLRICDMMGQMSYILRHGLEDVDPDVQATARYALNHMNHFRIVIDPQTDLPENTFPEQN
jgi:hypothetical protein